MEDRITVLEERLAHQQALLSDLDDALRNFVGRMEAVERRLEDLSSLVKDGAPEIGPANEKPPHY